MNDTTIIHLIKDICRLARAREPGKAGAAGAGAPRWNGNAVIRHLCLDRRNIDTATIKLFAQGIVIRTQRCFSLRIGGSNVVSLNHTIPRSTRERLDVAGIHVDNVPCRLCTDIGGKEITRLCNIFGQDRPL